ncbi:probable salivary secreted peptide [Stomoxys calcitrans]|uniref:Salivary secreted peptide n=1 Tax=Stomoxys calcitrans TaxID=35570 RepID=A0A1I8NX27_STOCA|nr:probable salivary secreted peptide [Stomoxys calcitrans]
MLRISPILVIVLLGLLANDTVSAAKSVNDKSHHVTFGAQGPREVHLGRFTAMEKFKPMQIVEGKFIYSVKPNDLHYDRTITRIVVTDQYDNGNGGYATLKDGGPSTNYAVIQFKSQRNHGYNFIIDIYGI